MEDIDSLHPFAFKQQSQDDKENLFSSLFATGDETLIAHLFSDESDCCIRPLFTSPDAFSQEKSLHFNRFDLGFALTGIQFTFIPQLLQQ